MTSKSNAFLAHHGVKGMKWGVRKDQHREYSEKATTATTNVLQRSQSAINMSRYFAAGARVKKNKKFDDVWYDNLSTGKEFIEAGTTLNRVVRAVNKDSLEGRLYVSSLQSDSDMYKAVIPAVQKSMSFGKKEYHSVYQVSMETKKGLSMPSAKERVDTFIEVIKTPEGKKWLQENGYKDQINELNAKQVGVQYYEKFNKYAGDQSSKLNDKYFDSIKAKGYNALIDDNDAGVWSKKPTILLSAKGDVRITDVKQLTADDINAAQKKVLEYRQYKTPKSAKS